MQSKCSACISGKNETKKRKSRRRKTSHACVVTWSAKGTQTQTFQMYRQFNFRNKFSRDLWNLRAGCFKDSGMGSHPTDGHTEHWTLNTGHWTLNTEHWTEKLTIPVSIVRNIPIVFPCWVRDDGGTKEAAAAENRRPPGPRVGLAPLWYEGITKSMFVGYIGNIIDHDE